MKKSSLIVFAVSLAVLLHDWGGAVMTPAFLTIVQEFQLTPVELGYLSSVYTLPGIFMSPLYGVLSNRYGRRRVLIPLMILFGFAGIGGSLAPTYLILLVFRTLQGFAVASYYPLAIIILGDLFDGDERGQAVGSLYNTLRVVGVVVPLIGGFLTLITWRWTLLSSIVAFPVTLFVIKVVPETKPDNLTIQDTQNHIELQPKSPQFSSRAVTGALTMGLVLFFFFAGGLILFTPFYIELGLGLSPAVTGIILALRTLLIVPVNYNVGKFMTVWPKPRIIFLAFLLFTGGFLFYLLPPNILWLAVATVLISTAIGLSFPTLNAYILDLTDPKRRGLITSTYQGTAKLGQTLGPMAFSYGYTWGNEALAVPFLMAIGFSSTAAAITVPMMRYTRQTGQGMPERNRGKS